MHIPKFFFYLYSGLYALIHLIFIARAILRPHREPASRVAWVVVIIILPILGMLMYILLGDTNVGKSRKKKACAILAQMPNIADAPGMQAIECKPTIPDRYSPL
ncbi:MAG: PLDc N-terminal domain-containing protein, partial [Arenimonas sp.]|nr:PLDc N-terminal domain-containing protein [Arenimonas sp.]